MNDKLDEALCAFVVVLTVITAFLMLGYFTYLMLNLIVYGPQLPQQPSRFSVNTVPFDSLSDNELAELWRRTTSECMFRGMWNRSGPSRHMSGNSTQHTGGNVLHQRRLAEMQ